VLEESVNEESDSDVAVKIPLVPLTNFPVDPTGGASA
jgi:hypothetical protein